MSDTLIAEANRRFRGDYYTPKVWVDEAHRMISDQLGQGWKEEYVVWDPAAGTKNLTRDYKFSNLFSSTLYEGELMATNKFNKYNVSFQYDFLNDDMCLHDGTISLEDLKTMTDEQLETTLKMPLELVKKLLNKEKVVFFTNPPYGQATSGQGIAHKAGTANTRVGHKMREDKLGHASGELYTQFIYRVQILADFFNYSDNDDLRFFFFFNKGFLTSPSYGKFVDGLTHQFSFNKGFMINAGEFEGTSEDWGIIFSHWSLQGEKDQTEFVFDVLRSTSEGAIEKITEWTARRVKKGETISDWLAEIPIGKQVANIPITQNGFSFPTGAKNYCKVKEDSIGYLLNKANSIQESDKGVGFFSLGYINAHGRDVTRENLERIGVTFSVRRSVRINRSQEGHLWIYDKDTFKRPPEITLTDEFIADCIVCSLFDSQSNQTSLRNYEYNGKTYRVENEFFPFSIGFINQLAVEHNNLDIQADLQGDGERFVYTWLQEHGDHLSPEASELLNLAGQLYRETFPYRDEYTKMQPRFQTNSWDAGFAQIARLAFGNDRINDEFLVLKEQFYAARAQLGEKIAQAAINDGII